MKREKLLRASLATPQHLTIEAFVIVGVILKPHGVRGAMKVRPLINWSSLLGHIQQLFVSQVEGTFEPLRIEGLQQHGRAMTLKVEGIADRDAAESMRGLYLYLPRDDKALENGFLAPADILGLNVVDTNGASIGTLDDILTMPAHDVYVVRDGERDHLIPAVPEFIRSIDLHARVMTVNVIEGLLGEA